MRYLFKTKEVFLSLSVLKWSSVWIIFLMSLNSFVDLINVYLISKLVGSKNILGEIDLNIIILDNNWFLFLLFSVILFKLFLGYFFNKTLYSFSTSLEDDLRMDLFNSLSKISHIELIKYSAADLSHTIAELTRNYANGYVVPFFRLFNEILIVLLMTSYLIYVNAQIFLVILIVVLVIAVMLKVFFRKDKGALGEKNIQLTMSIVNIVNVFKSGYKEIYVNKKFDYFKLRLTHLSSLLKLNQLKYLMKSTMPKIYLEFLSIFLIILCIHLFQYFNFENPLFVLASIVLVLLRLGPSISSVNSLIIQLRYNYSSWSRISFFKRKYVFNRIEHIDSDSVDTVHTLRISNITFSYGNKQIFNNAKVVFKKGKCYVLSGQSGIGKSTFLDLISGIHNSEVRFEINEISQTNINKYISYLPQEPFIFNGTILENLIFKADYSSEFEKESVLNLLSFLELDSFIDQFENGIFSEVSLNDSRISGGQKQRIGFARMILMDKEILLLDEFSSALDSKMTKKLVKFLEGYSVNKIVIIVSHDVDVINTLKDKICIIDQKIYSQDS